MHVQLTLCNHNGQFWEMIVSRNTYGKRLVMISFSCKAEFIVEGQKIFGPIASFNFTIHLTQHEFRLRLESVSSLTRFLWCKNIKRT